MGLALRLTFHRAAEILGITTDDVRSLVVEMPRRLPAIYVTQVGYAEPYEWQLLRVDSAGNAFDMSVGGIDGAVHTGFLRIESAALEKFIRDNDLPARHETEFAPHPATEPGAPVPKPQAAAPAPVADESESNAPLQKAKAKRRTWWDVSIPYIVEVMRAGRYTTAKELYRALESKAGANSPFDKGTGDNRGSLFVRDIAESLSLKTVQNNWQSLREQAKK